MIENLRHLSFCLLILELWLHWPSDIIERYEEHVIMSLRHIDTWGCGYEI